MMKMLLATLLIAVSFCNSFAQTSLSGTNKTAGTAKYTSSHCNPGMFPDAVGWVDGSAASFNGTMTDGTAVGDTNSRWQNKLATSRYFSQGTAGNRPVFRTGGPRGHNYVSFDSNDQLTYSTSGCFWLSNFSCFYTGNGFTKIYVVRPTAAANGNALYTQGGYVTDTFLSSSGSRFQAAIFANSSQRTVNATTTYTTNNWYVLEVWFTGNAGTVLGIRFNGDTPVTTNATGFPSSALDAPTFGNGGIAFDLLASFTWARDIGSANRTTFCQCLNEEFGTTGTC